MWNMIVIIAMVGYGELYPATHIGRVVGLTGAILCNLLIAIMVVSLTFTSQFSPQQRKAYEMINADLGNYELYGKAIKLIQSALRYRVYMKKTLKPSPRTQAKLLARYRLAARNFSRHRKWMGGMDQDIP